MSISIQKADFWKRISAWLFDAIIAVTLALGGCLIAGSVFNFDALTEKYDAHLQPYYQTYGEKYGIDFFLSQEEYDAYTPEQQLNYDNNRAAAEREMHLALSEDETYIELTDKIFRLTIAIVAVGVLSSYLIIYFGVPLLFKNGQTLGKKMFGLAVIRTNGVKASNPVLFIRSIVGLYAMETMAPLLIVLMIYFNYLGIVGTATLALIAILQCGVMIKTPTNSSIHDLLSDTVVVDLVSQRIFDTEEERIEYIAEQQRLADNNQ